MALYVVPVAAPPSGDWRTVVPGQFLWDVVAVSATLGTGADPTVCHDATGAGNNLAYTPGVLTFGVAGYVTGDPMVQFSANSIAFVAAGTIDTTFLTANDLSFNLWTSLPALPGRSQPMIAFTGANSILNFTLNTIGVPAGSAQLSLGWSNLFPFGSGFVGAVDVWPAGRHMISVRYDLATDTGHFYLDGVPFGPAGPPSGFPPNVDTSMLVRIGRSPDSGTFPFYDEIAFGGNPTVDADYVALFAARNNFASYTTQQLSMGPEGYYHLDETFSATGRQVDLVVTDGTRTVVEIPTGSGVPAGAGPYGYSWQPTLNSTTVTPDGLVSTVAIPKLIVPAGYTIGTRTLDLVGTDQWSNINIWWDDNVMQADPGFNPIDYPPGAYLVIVPQGA